MNLHPKPETRRRAEATLLPPLAAVVVSFGIRFVGDAWGTPLPASTLVPIGIVVFILACFAEALLQRRSDRGPR